MQIEHTIEVDGREIVFDVQVRFTPRSDGCEGKHSHGDPDNCEAPSSGYCDVESVSITVSNLPGPPTAFRTPPRKIKIEIDERLWPILFGPNFEREIAEKAEKQYEESKP